MKTNLELVESLLKESTTKIGVFDNDYQGQEWIDEFSDELFDEIVRKYIDMSARNHEEYIVFTYDTDADYIEDDMMLDKVVIKSGVVVEGNELLDSTKKEVQLEEYAINDNPATTRPLDYNEIVKTLLDTISAVGGEHWEDIDFNTMTISTPKSVKISELGSIINNGLRQQGFITAINNKYRTLFDIVNPKDNFYISVSISKNSENTSSDKSFFDITTMEVDGLDTYGPVNESYASDEHVTSGDNEDSVVEPMNAEWKLIRHDAYNKDNKTRNYTIWCDEDGEYNLVLGKTQDDSLIYSSKDDYSVYKEAERLGQSLLKRGWKQQ